MATKNNRRTKITKMLLQESLIELMNHKTISQITIKEICENAELNRSTFYLHYNDQYQLLEEIEQAIFDETNRYLQNVVASADTTEYVQNFLDYMKKNKDIFSILLCKQENISFQERFISSALKNAQAYINLGCPKHQEPYIFSFIISGCSRMICDWIANDFPVSSSELSEMIVHLCDTIRKNY